jgi:hypothetical protein
MTSAERGNECEQTTRQSKVDGALARVRGTHPQDALATSSQEEGGAVGVTGIAAAVAVGFTAWANDW